MKRFWSLAVALIVSAVVGTQAQAGLLPVNVTVIPEAGNYRWTYAIVLPTDMKLQSGNFFTIYDFHGLVAGSESAPEGWTLSTNPKGPTPDRLNPQDDLTVANLTWTYNGPTIPTGQIGLGNFWASSTYGEEEDSFFTARTNRSSDGRFDSNITETIVPNGETTVPPPVPEPTTLALAALGLPLVSLARRFRRS
ncbi:MAG: PEP-CTERM sorting domain-containing protein [Fimbriiglobus sp.]